MNLNEVISFQDALERINGRTRHLLIGNGFSIACDPIFSYGSLYDRAIDRGPSGRAVALFNRLGTNNFEAVMRLLADGQWLGAIYGVPEQHRNLMDEDLRIVKETLIAVIAESHPDHTGLISDERKIAAATFFRNFSNVYSLNYDLLPYWVNLAAGARPIFEDGFRADPENPDDSTLLFCEPPGRRPGLFFMHGALHIFASRSGIRKHTWSRTNEPLTRSVREGLANNRFPLFVAEGESEQKRSQILNSSYLAYCFGKLGRIEAPLMTFGWSFGDSDRHIVDSLARNVKLRRMFVGVIGRPTDRNNESLVRNLQILLEARQTQSGYDAESDSLEIVFYDATSASVWDTT